MYRQNRAVSDEEDIMLSVFGSVYIAVENGRFLDMSDRDDLWRLLLRMFNRRPSHRLQLKSGHCFAGRWPREATRKRERQPGIASFDE
ncbi:MAG: hypothetical protein KDB05_11695 [Planctomycetales bacterium]|nr:hypothetical protein [Planctomycetales bacterium]